MWSKDKPEGDNIKPFIKALEIFMAVIQTGKKKVPHRSLPINNRVPGNLKCGVPQRPYGKLEAEVGCSLDICGHA